MGSDIFCNYCYWRKDWKCERCTRLRGTGSVYQHYFVFDCTKELNDAISLLAI